MWPNIAFRKNLQIDSENAPHIALVITPLRSLMFHQVARLNSCGIKAAAITKKEEMSIDIEKSKFAV